jgi:hypothetical protein
MFTDGVVTKVKGARITSESIHKYNATLVGFEPSPADTLEREELFQRMHFLAERRSIRPNLLTEYFGLPHRVNEHYELLRMYNSTQSDEEMRRSAPAKKVAHG